MHLTATQGRLLVVGIVVIYLGIMIVFHRRRIGQIFSAFGGMRIQQNGLDGKNLRSVLLGAIYTYQQSGYLNTLSMGLDRRKMKNILEKYWDLYDAESTKQELHDLIHTHRHTFISLIVEAVKSDDKEELIASKLGLDMKKYYKDGDEDMSDEELEKLETYSSVLEQSNTLLSMYGELKHSQIIENYSDVIKYGVRGRDLGRASFMTRLAYDYGYLSEQEAWTLLHTCYEVAKKDFSSRENFFKSYVIGRALRGGVNSDNAGIASLAQELLTDEKSPIRGLSF